MSTDSLVREVRLRKSDVEIATLGRAARIADLTVEHLALTCAPRHTTRELAAAGYQFALKAGADNGRLLLLSAGRGEVVFHGQLNDEQVKVGDIVHVEAVPQVRGYSARIMRPISVGPPTPETRDIASTLIDIQDRQIDAMVHGASAREVDALCREPMIQSGLRDCYPNATAYTLGLHATPKTSDFTRALLPGCDWSLEEGMVFHVYTAAGSLAFSETILVRQDHSERLTHAARRVYVAESDK